MNIERLAQEIRHGALAAGLVVACVAPGPLTAQSSGGAITGTVTTKAAAARPLRITIDQRVCGNELPDEAIVADGSGRLANVIVTLVGVKARRAAQGSGIMNETPLRSAGADRQPQHLDHNVEHGPDPAHHERPARWRRGPFQRCRSSAWH